MKGFRQFYEAKVDDETEKSLTNLPKKHRELVKDYRFRFENGVNLKGYPDSIGLIHLGNPDKKIIQIAAPWRHSREFATLHEVAHKVYEKLMTDKLRKKWSNLVKKTELHKDAAKEKNDEELFAHHYAQYYCNNKVVRYDHPELLDFIKNLP
jgi:hypothetical protein